MDTEKEQAKKKTHRPLVLIIIIVLLIIGLSIGYLVHLMQKTNYDNSQDENIITNETEIPDEVLTGYKNFVVFGVDSRSNSLTSDTRSDTIMLVSINNDTKEVKLCSIYRDTYVKIPDETYTKINHAYAKGGYSLALSTINTNFDLDMTQYVTVNFYAVAKIVDLLGGVTLDIQEDELKWLNGYVRENNRVNGTNVAGLSSAGTQVVNGTQALAYARIRYTAGGDFKRTERQRIVVNQIFKEAKEADLNTIISIINEMLPEISTNIKTTDMFVLAKNILSYNITDSTGFPFEKSTDYINKVSYVIPLNLSENVSKLHEYLFHQTDYIPSDTVNSYSDYIKSLGY